MSLRAMMAGAALVGLLAGCAGAPDAPAPATAANSSLGPVLADANGMTLYTFDRDQQPGKSACNGRCAALWPPLMAGTDAKAMGAWTVVKRDDGRMQWAYRGKPLYAWAKDAKAGDVTGEGVNNVWHVARP